MKEWLHRLKSMKPQYHMVKICLSIVLCLHDCQYILTVSIAHYKLPVSSAVNLYQQSAYSTCDWVMSSQSDFEMIKESMGVSNN